MISNITNITNKLDFFYILILIIFIIYFYIYIFMMNTSDNEMGNSDKNNEDFNINEFINFPDSDSDSNDDDDDDENSRKRKRISNNNNGDENYIKKKRFDIIKCGGKIYKSNGSKALLDIYKNSKSTFFKKYEPEKNILHESMQKTKDIEVITTFKNSIDDVLKNRDYIDVSKYGTMHHVRDKRKYNALIKSFKSVQAKNRNLNLN